ncbi:LysR substrate-binding domain-containing protein [Cohaesibacter intestini]|uniref:LysR substrate-binding domain-containing protein n=1 Tax=Cohaesibacter intestini TaxID=2211145 RepID=UPI000DE88303|nr:LysR substrate-binding domain-containing protein [Cohaesibacter intestini]
MMHLSSRLPLKAIVYFEAVARLRTLTRASEELSVSSSAISQQIKLLENSLGIALFRRVKRNLVLTEDGERLFKATSEALSIIRRTERQISRRMQQRPLMVRVAPSFGTLWLTKRLPDFIRANPDIDIRVDATSELTDFDKEQVDIEIRYGRETIDRQSSQLLVEDTVLPLCNQEIYSHFAYRDPAEVLQSISLIQSVKSDVSWERWMVENGLNVDNAARIQQFDRSAMAIFMAQEGLGVTLESTTLTHDAIVDGSLRPLFPMLKPVRNASYWMICPSHHLSRRPVHEFRAWLLEEVARDKAALTELQDQMFRIHTLE